LFGLAASSPPFQPTLSTQPNDFTIAVNFTGGNLSAPSALASDASGNVWIANSGGNTLTEMSHAGAVLSSSGFTNGLNNPSGIAIDPSGAAWVANKGNNTVSRFTIAGAPAAAPYSGGGLNQPTGIAFDSFGNAWVGNSGNASVTEINSAGTTLTNYTPVGASTPLGIAVSPH
jgi:streptogramin lyase